MSSNLNTWLKKQLEQRHWSHNELARRADLSQAAISSVLKDKRNAGADFCIKIAHALGESPEKVLRLAGILPPVPVADDPILQEIIDTLSPMSSEQRKEALEYIRYLRQRRKIE
ncbi:MAG: helix-turn-helix transcriptional regulator [Anaerolineales bacterium]|nr:helix-turn-helix transcriptional regulator [Anaerolineales bacterium]